MYALSGWSCAKAGSGPDLTGSYSTFDWLSRINATGRVAWLVMAASKESGMKMVEEIDNRFLIFAVDVYMPLHAFWLKSVSKS
jgi:hypothetical protein